MKTMAACCEKRNNVFLALHKIWKIEKWQWTWEQVGNLRKALKKFRLIMEYGKKSKEIDPKYEKLWNQRKKNQTKE